MTTDIEGVAKLASKKANPIKKAARTRKAVSAFRRKGREYRTWRGRIVVHLEVDSIDLKLLNESIFTDLQGWNIVDHYDVIHLTQVNTTLEHTTRGVDDELKHEMDGGGFIDEEKEDMDASLLMEAITPQVFIFSFGAVVFWNFSDSASERTFLEENLFCYPDICGDLLPREEIDNANDEIEFVYDTIGDFKIRQHVVSLVTREAGEKLAMSFAFAKSALLSVYEGQVQKQIIENASIPEELARTGRVQMKMKSMSMCIGQIFLIKHGVNLDTFLQDTPVEFWDNHQFINSYSHTLTYFEINKRLNLVNNRLQMIQDLHQVLIEREQNKHDVYLYWIIIVLIAVFLFGELAAPLIYVWETGAESSNDVLEDWK